MNKIRVRFDFVQFVISHLFIIPGIILIGLNTNWYVALGAWLMIVGATIKVNRE
jgi:hypothetical protein